VKRIHILQHVPYETPGCIETWVKLRGYAYSSTAFYAGETLPDISDIDWLIVMGGPMSVHDITEFPWLAVEKKFITDAVTEKKAIIGVCLGAQLVAEVLGSRVYRNSFKEIGWFPVKRTSCEDKSDLLQMFNDSEIVFHWHGDTFDIPEGAVHMMTSDGCLNQCFIYNERVIGLQFHLEVTENLLQSMIVNGVEEITSDRYINDEEQLKMGSHYIERNNELMYSIMDKLDKLNDADQV